MKTVHKMRTSGESCSCTTCVYKSESDHPSLRRIIDRGSRIDRLYYGKYIPLRERKLLDRLVRTRAVYDDIRAQLVSDSTLSLSTKGDYNPRKKVPVRELDDTEKSSGAVLELVNMVDRGAIGSKKLDECCSCCSCSSKIKIHEQRHRQKRSYQGADALVRQRRLNEIRRRKKGVRFKTKHIRSDPCTCTFKLIKKQSKAMLRKMHQGPPVPLLDLQSKTDEEIKRLRGRIGDIARTSYQNLKESNTRMKEKISEGIAKLRESQTRIQEKIELQAKLSKEKLIQAKDKLTSKMREINKNEWQLGPENELAFHVRKDSISKFKEELRRKQIMKDWECEPECFEDICVPKQCFIKLKQKKFNMKNIHHKGMNYNIKTQERKAGDQLRHYNHKIQAENSTKTKTIETKRPVLRKQKSREIQKSHVSLDKVPKKTQKEKEINLLKVKPFTVTPDRISVENEKTSYSARKAKLEKSSLERKSSQRQAVRIGSSFSFNVEFYKDLPGQEIPPADPQTYRGLKEHPGIDYRYKKPVKDKKTKNRHRRQQGSQIEFKRTFKDTQTSGRALKRCFCTLKLKAKGTKSKIRHPISKKLITIEKSVLTLSSPTALTVHDVQTNTEDKRVVHEISNLLSYECEPGVCVPGDCDPYQCIKIINKREAKRKNSSTQARKTKSTSSFTSEPYKSSKAKNVQSKVSHRGKASKPKASKAVEKKRMRPANATKNNYHRQAVRIGSTFSFNLEFYKDSPYDQQASRPQPPPSDVNTLSIKPKQTAYREVKLKDRGYQGDLGNVHKNAPTQVIKKERNARIGTTIRRCFCTLALQGKDVMKKHSTKTFAIGTETSELKPIDTANKGTKTKLKYSQNISLEPYECEPFTCVPESCDPYICLDRINMRKIRLKQGGITSDRDETSLEPYECEPFTCIPGECDPNICLERINKRNKRLRDVGLTTGRSKTTSSSSGNTYLEKSLRTVQVQYKPKHKERKILAKTQKPKKYTTMKSEKYDVFKYPFNAKSRQAVKIGSTFSFDIEFYKNKSPTQEIKEVYPAKRKSKARKKNNKKSIDKGIKINRLNVAQEETQVQASKKHDKGSVVRPLLKRCFCTLNLQKKWKHQYSKKETSPSEKVLFQPPRVYTVNRAMIGVTQGITRNTYQIPCHSSSQRRHENDQQNESSLVIQDIKDNIKGYKIDKTWKPSMSQQWEKTNRIYSQQCVEKIVDTRSFTRNPSLNVQVHKTRLSSLTCYFRRCYYTMNLKVESEGNYKGHEDIVSSKRKTHALHKLLPYECEPGVCIPGECNPYECQKMIAKRLMKSPSKKSGTEYSYHSISSSANQLTPRAKQHKQQTLINKPRKPQVYTEKLQLYKRTGKTDQKQAVRIGSSFSFDIEFSKKLGTSHKDVGTPKYSSETTLSKRIHSSKSKGTGNKKLNSDSQSQSASVKTKHKESFTKPIMKRCFCTLKLQKQGRLHKEFKNQQALSDFSKEKTVSRGQNTKKIKPLKLSPALKPYECEPNICIPGQCDPYQCLERIKKRNNYGEEVGTNTIFYDTKSISSMNTDNQGKNIRRSRAVSVKPKKSTIKEKGGKKYSEFSNLKPSREAVRVGSSFSFNIEFYKDAPPSHPHETHTYVKGESKELKNTKEPLPTLKKHETDTYAQNNNNMLHKKSQFVNLARHASTMTNSFIKRCFCTAQLHKTSKNTDEIFKSTRNENSSSLIKRCFCVLKKIKLSKNNTKNDIKPTETQDKKINTVKRQDKAKLEPYECKPGICVPGECDPYICDKIMKKYRHQNSKAISCVTLKTRSISSNSANIAKKNVKSSIKREENLTIKNGSIKRQSVETSKSINKPNRNAVRIGSQFSFDIEFFKEHPLNIEHNQQSITHKEKSLKHTGTKKKVKISSTKSFSPSYISQSSQVKKDKVKDRGIGINHLMKRCFCTLKLNENNEHSGKASKRQEIDDQILKKVKTKSVMTEKEKNLLSNALLPYECEPNTCIPYKCDPYECEKRIKLRHKNKVKREFGVSTSPPKKVSAHSITDTIKPKTKIRSLSTKNLDNVAKETPIKYSSRSNVGQPKQSVRIGSAFSFNIEFFKDKNNGGVEFQKLPKKDYNDRLKNQMKDKRLTIRNQTKDRNKRMDTSQTQISKKLMSTNETQLADQVMRTQSTMTGFTPKKRCFCTLSLKKSKDKQPLPPKKLNASTETEVFKTTTHPISHLLPYECEPNICVPGECNPIQCLERIKGRQNTLLPYECEPNICIPGKCNPFQCLERIKRRQNTLLPYECEPNICIPGECNPVQCLEKIKRRNKTFGTGTKELPRNDVSTLMQHADDVKNKKSQIKQLHQPISKKVLLQKTGNNKNRQAVRISSNFNFDIEFFRINNLNASELPKLDKSKHHFKNKTASSHLETKKLYSRALQSSPKKVSHGASVGPFLKRCFCTLKLQKTMLHKDPITVDKHLTKTKHRQISTESKATATKKIQKTYNLSPFECEPFFCVPGQCDPYECAKRIEMRDKKHKSQNTIAQSHDHKGVGVKQDNMKTQRNQANFIETNAFVPKSIDRSEMVEMPRFYDGFNKQAVRIGSNFSFNIEFHKQNLSPTYNTHKQGLVDHKNDKKLKRKKQKNIHHDEKNTDRTHLRSIGSEYDKAKTLNKSVKTENRLKRCFCTLELHNKLSSQKKNQQMQNKVPFSQNFEVRRVAVQHNPKMLSKGTHIKVKSVSTKINKKLLKRSEDLNIPCNCYICKNGKTLFSDDMKTILPFSPEKFNKTLSRTVIPPENINNKSKGSGITNGGKRLTRKRSKKHLHIKKPITLEKDKINKSFGIKKIFACCAKIFNLTPKSQNFFRNEKKERQASPDQFMFNLKPKKCNKICPYNSVNQNGDIKQKYPSISVKINKKEIIKRKSLNKKSNTKQQIVSKMKNKERFCPCPQKLLHKNRNTKHKSLNVNWNPNQGKNIKINEDRDHPNALKVSFFDTVKSDKKNLEKLTNSKNKRFASGTKSERLVPSNYCQPCKGKITKEEFHKAAGDQVSIYQKLANKKGSNCNVAKMMSKIREVCCSMHPERPLFEMQVDSESYEILNRNEVVHNITKLNTKCKPRIEMQVDSKMHKILNKDKLCPCRHCVCDPGTSSKILKPSRKPCICGSSVCAKKLQSVRTPITRRKWKTCICGSPVCDKESAKIQSYVENKCLCQKEMALRKAKLKAKKLAKEEKERAIRLKVYKKSDKMRRKKRKKDQKRLEKKIDKKATDGILFAESALDIGKLGITATTDVLRQVIRCARDPKQAYQTLRTLKENPMLAAQFLKSAYNDTGFTATLRRVRLRCLAMRGMKKLRSKLESYPASKYLMYIGSKDPKRRLLKTKKKKKPQRVRERMDFNCSLYMASLRRRPFLSVYDRWPWFYQHFLNLVHAWKQFLDICLFLLAAVVWSPCILCMEVCRACLCCFFCTG